LSQQRGNLHLDKNAAKLVVVDLPDDQLITTDQLASWLDVSREWCEKKRALGGGPEYIALSPRKIRYRVGDVKAWLRKRRRSRVRRRLSQKEKEHETNLT
jgi:hypothetical protein